MVRTLRRREVSDGTIKSRRSGIESRKLLHDRLQEKKPESETIMALSPGKRKALESRLINAVKKGNNKKVQELLEKGVDPNCKEREVTITGAVFEDTALMLAASSGKLKTMELLLSYGADVDANMEGRCAISEAAVRGKLKAVKFLIENGADVDSKKWDGFSVLMEAIMWDQPKIAELLIKAGADVNATSDNGRTALILASGDNHHRVMEMLIENGADVNAVESGGGTAMSYVVSRVLFKNMGYEDSHSSKRVEICQRTMEILISHGANVNNSSDEGFTALMGTAMVGQVEILRLLVENGAEVNMHSDYKRRKETKKTALDYAIKEKNREAAAYLREVGGLRYKELADAN